MTRRFTYWEAVNHECDDENCDIYDVALELMKQPACGNCGYDCLSVESAAVCNGQPTN